MPPQEITVTLQPIFKRALASLPSDTEWDQMFEYGAKITTLGIITQIDSNTIFGKSG